MLKGIHPILSPEALHAIASMGHGDELLIADGNYPAAAKAKRLIRFDGHPISLILAGLLDLFPLDSFIAQPIILMDVPEDVENPPVWEEYRNIITKKDVLFSRSAAPTPTPAAASALINAPTPTPAAASELADSLTSATTGRSWENSVEHLERFAFYKRADDCFAVFASGETALYANIILKKGVLKKEDLAL
ncbi:MAG: RbsD/FucU family protein [Salinispira sp.]